MFGFIFSLLIGALAGYIAGRIMEMCIRDRVLSSTQSSVPRFSRPRSVSVSSRLARVTGELLKDVLLEFLAHAAVSYTHLDVYKRQVFGKPAIVTDTHCIRLCNKIGLVDGIKEPQTVEMALWKIVPPEEGSDLCHLSLIHIFHDAAAAVAVEVAVPAQRVVETVGLARDGDTADAARLHEAVEVAVDGTKAGLLYTSEVPWRHV